MEKRLLVFDISDRHIDAGAFVGDHLQSVLVISRKKGWERWLEGFISDHLATGPCTAVASTADAAVEKLSRKLKLDLQTFEGEPLLSGAAKLYPDRDAIVISIGRHLTFQAIGGGKVLGGLLAEGIPDEPPSPPKGPLGRTTEQQIAAGHYQRVLGTIERTLRLLRTRMPSAVILATGRATSELTIDDFSATMRFELEKMVDLVESDLRIIGIREALTKGR